MTEFMRNRVFTGFIGRLRSGEITDWLVVAIALFLPWSTTAIAILIPFWLWQCLRALTSRRFGAN